MTGFEIGLSMFAGVLVLIALRMPVGVAMLLVGGLGYAAITGWTPLLATMRSMSFSKFSSYTLSVIPLFLLMGDFATKGGLNRALFQRGARLAGAPARWARSGHHRRLRGVRGDFADRRSQPPRP